MSTAPSSAYSIIDALPGPPEAPRQKVNTLIENVDAFSHIYASLARKSTRPESIGGRYGETGVLGSDESDNIQRRNCVESDVVAGVAASLRTLCDEL